MSYRDVTCLLCFILVVTQVVSAGCSHLERMSLPISHRVDPRVRDKETVRIDDQVYVRVPNPEAQTGGNQERYRYVSLQEYLANPKSFDTVVTEPPIREQDEWRPVELETAAPPPAQESDSAGQLEVSLHFKKRLMLVPFKDLTGASYKELADMVMRGLVSEIQAASDQVILFDADILETNPKGRELGSESFDSPNLARLASELYNIHAIVVGTINHVFTSSTDSKVRGTDKTSYAIAEVSAQLIDTASGRVRRQWQKRNPTLDSEGKGDFSGEKARLKAIDLIASELSQDIIEELKRLAWYTTIASLDGNRVYISAGKLSGVRVGDVFSVYPATYPGDSKGEIRIAGLFGVDASVADITRGKGFQVKDLVRPIFQ